MDRQWIRILATLLFYNKLTVGAGSQQEIKEGLKVEMRCRPSEIGSMIMWFRVLDDTGVEFLATFSNSGMFKAQSSSFSSTFSDLRIHENILTLKSFNKGRDSGIYSCASLKGTELSFGDVVRLMGEKVEAASKDPPTVKVNPSTSTLLCPCENATRQSDSILCNPVILFPLAGSCGLLLLLILIIVVYCNRVRTRRCPHHNKKRPLKKMAPGKQPPQHT